MSKNHQPYKNNEIRKAIKDLANLEQYTDKVPAELCDDVQLGIDVTPLKNNLITITAFNALSNQANVLIYTTPTDKDFYLCGFNCAFIKDNTSTSTSVSLTVVINATTAYLASFPCLTLTPQDAFFSQDYMHPIKLDRGTNILLVSSTDIANIKASATIWGFTADNKTYDMGIGAQA